MYRLKYWLVKLFHTHTKILNNLHHTYIKHVCENGGDILEIGFGAGITANLIQKYNIKTHTIIERDKYYFDKLLKWSVNKPNVKVVYGDWVTDIPNDKKYKGIFFDLWNESEDYYRRVSLCNVLENHIKPGSVFLCATEKAFDKNLYIEKGHKYEEIKVKQIKLKWYNLLSGIIKVNHKEENKVIQRLDLIPKITYR
jgi:hypothetical protein